MCRVSMWAALLSIFAAGAPAQSRSPHAPREDAATAVDRRSPHAPREDAVTTHRDEYLTHIKPLLRARCYACHGALKQQAGLRLDTAAAILRGSKSGAVIEPGDSAASRLIARISAADPAQRMPPEHEGDPLSPEQIAMVRRWINAGAPAPTGELPEPDPRDHWSFQPIVRPAVPGATPAWGRNPIDAFLAKRHAEHELTPQVEAPRIVLLRRLYLDLIGIPPSDAEIATFENDTSTDWYERAVHRLLDDPRHGERWARHWMDIWRYSDWWGLGDQLRNSQPHIWHWRDWIIESLNRDLPYDEMVRQMLAADELYPNDLDKLRASGYLARNWYLFNRNQWMEETVEHVGKAFLGLTLNCAKCHDHKYDPIDHADFYRMRAFFEPYHVRIDLVPGEADPARDGIPRAFDGLLDAPTYRFERGDEKHPDTSAAIAPGVPELFKFAKLDIEPVTLPVEAARPDRRPWIPDAHAKASAAKVQAAESELADQRKRLDEAKKLETELAAATPPAATADPLDAATLRDTFEQLDETRWRLLGGQWSHRAGHLEQRQDGPSRSAARLAPELPQDFDATMRFRILGGSMWRSVGLSFDTVGDDPTKPGKPGETELLVYVSAVAGGSKVQASYRQADAWQYPSGDAVRAMPIELDREYVLRVQARGTLVNASLDGNPVIAWRTPIARRGGAMQLITFDALAVFHEMAIGPLAPDVVLREPSVASGAKPQSIEAARSARIEAEFRVAVADASLVLARAEQEAVDRRAAAMRAQCDGQAAEPARQEAIAAAVAAERAVAVAKAKRALADSELAHARAAADKREAAAREIEKARTTVQEAETNAAAPIAPDASFTPLPGAAWSPTRFLSSLKDDPAVAFPATSTGRRTALARWITDPRNPLAPRAAVNHIWTRHMVEPLVPTVFDLGRNGVRPTHPELVDWLAAEFVENGWSMKHLHRLIVTSAAYRMSSSVRGREVNVDKDPDNRHWWRRVPGRLESQVVRDSILALAGTLDTAIGGPPVLRDQQASSTRRSLYFFHSNNERNMFLTTFDEALVKDCYRREQSIVPQQALALTHSGLVLDAAGRIAARLSEGAADEFAFLRKAFAVVVGIRPSESELGAAAQALAAWRGLPQGSDEAARAHLIWVLLNHNDFVTMR